MKRIIALMLAAVMALGIFAGCAQEPVQTPADDTQPAVPMNVVALSGPTGIGMAKLAADGKENGKYNVTFASAPDEITGLIVNGEVDVACVPTNLAAALYAKTNGSISVTAVTTMGVLYLLDKTGEIESIADLEGKTVGATGQGSNPEYILNYILAENGLTVGENVNVNFYGEHAELASLMISGEVDIAMLPVPFATQVEGKIEGINVLNLQDEWNKVCDTALAQGVVIVRNEYLENNKEQFDAFLDDLKASTEYAVNDVEGAAQLCGDLGIIAQEVALKAIPYCNLTFSEGAEMKATVSAFLQVLFDANPKATGGSLPGDEFYYAR